MAELIEVFFYSYYLNAEFLKERGGTPRNPRPARLHHWKLYLGGDSTLFSQKDTYADGVIYSLTEQELNKLYSTTNFTPRNVIVTLLPSNSTISVRCYIDNEPSENAYPEKASYIKQLIQAMDSYGLDTKDAESIYLGMIEKA